MALSPLATEFLKSIGWYPGRKLPLETVQKAYPENYEFLFDAAIEYLQEFGMLSLQSCTTPQLYPITRNLPRPEIFDFTFAYLAWGGGGKLEFLKKLTGKTWCPVGVGYNYTGLFVSKDSEFLVLDVHWIGWGLYDHYHESIEMISGNKNAKSHDVYLDASIEIPEDCSPSIVPDDYREP